MNLETLDKKRQLIYQLSKFRTESAQNSRIRFENKLRQLNGTLDAPIEKLLVSVFNRFDENEDDVTKAMIKVGKDVDIVKDLKALRGISDVLATRIFGELNTTLSDKPSQFLKQCGYDVLADGSVPTFATRNENGKLPYNPNRKKLAFLIGDCMIKANSPYKEIYDREKARWSHIYPDKTKGHVHNHARRFMISIFLIHYWTQSRLRMGLPIRKPYVEEKLLHTGIIQPYEMGWPEIA